MPKRVFLCYSTRKSSWVLLLSPWMPAERGGATLPHGHRCPSGAGSALCHMCRGSPLMCVSFLSQPWALGHCSLGWPLPQFSAPLGYDSGPVTTLFGPYLRFLQRGSPGLAAGNSHNLTPESCRLFWPVFAQQKHACAGSSARGTLP